MNNEIGQSILRTSFAHAKHYVACRWRRCALRIMRFSLLSVRVVFWCFVTDAAFGLAPRFVMLFPCCVRSVSEVAFGNGR